MTTKGFEQAELLAKFLLDKGIDRVICSPHLRAQQSNAPFVQRNNIELTVDNRLSERVLSDSNMDNWLYCLRQTFAMTSICHLTVESRVSMPWNGLYMP